MERGGGTLLPKIASCQCRNHTNPAVCCCLYSVTLIKPDTSLAYYHRYHHHHHVLPHLAALHHAGLGAVPPEVSFMRAADSYLLKICSLSFNYRFPLLLFLFLP